MKKAVLSLNMHLQNMCSV